MTKRSGEATLIWSPIARFAMWLERDDATSASMLWLPAFLIWEMARFCVYMLLVTYDDLFNRVFGIVFTLSFAASTIALVSMSATGWAAWLATIAKIVWITSAICGVADAFTERQRDRLENLEWERRFPNGWNIEASLAWEDELEAKRNLS